MKSLKELNAERTKQAEEFLHPALVKSLRQMAKADAAKGDYTNEIAPYLNKLADHVYLMAWSNERYRLSREKRDAADQQLRAGDDRE